jgi:hypothetical protein
MAALPRFCTGHSQREAQRHRILLSPGLGYPEETGEVDSVDAEANSARSRFTDKHTPLIWLALKDMTVDPEAGSWSMALNLELWRSESACRRKEDVLTMNST